MALIGEATQVTPNRYMTYAALRRLAAIAEMGAQQTGCFTAGQFRDWTGLGHNLTIEMLEYFDRAGLTRRQGDVRAVVRRPAEVFGSGPVAAEPLPLPAA